MARTFEEMCKARDPLYAAMQPVGEFQWALDNHWTASQWWWSIVERDRLRRIADAALLRLAVRALRNQGQPYYRVR